MGEFMNNLNIKEVEGGKKKVFIRLSYYLWAAFSSIAAICIAALAIINSTWIYSIIVSKYRLAEFTGLSEDALVRDYKGLINYLQNPFIDKLNFENFTMSTYGEIHFVEVKRIFLMLILITVIFLTALAVMITLRKNKRVNKEGLLKSFNSSSNILIGFFIGIVILYLIDFSWAFTMLHKIFFRNDYWIFDPKLDPVIIALPEELFMICGGAILIILLIMITVVKVIYYRKNRSSLYLKDSNIDTDISYRS